MYTRIDIVKDTLLDRVGVFCLSVDEGWYSGTFYVYNSELDNLDALWGFEGDKSIFNRGTRFLEVIESGFSDLDSVLDRLRELRREECR